MIPNLPSPPFRDRWVPAVLAVLVAVLLAAGVTAAVTESGDGEPRAGSATSTSAPARLEQAVPPPEASPPATPTKVDPLPHVPPGQRRGLEDLMAQVAEVRGLPWKEPLQLRVVTRDEMVRRLLAANARDVDAARVSTEEAFLKLLGLLPATLDYPGLIDQILRSAVLGFYDPETKELYVAVRDANALDGAEKATIVHEMTHALTDQHFAYGPRTIALDKADKADEALAFTALLEGDARLTEFLWMEKYLDEIEALAVLLGAAADTGEGVDVLSRVPSYVRRALVFPYEAGRELVKGLHSAGGFAAVNAAYRRPPASSEHVLHPQTYIAGQSTAPPSAPDAGATGCRRVRAGALGEFDMQAVLDQHAPGAATAAAGWNGDTYSLLRCGQGFALVDRWQADSDADARRLAEALGRWAVGWSGGSGPRADGRFAGPSGAGRIVRNGARIDVVMARDSGIAERLGGALR